MVKLTTQKTSFTAGEISPRLLGRGDLTAYANGTAKLRNVQVHPTGGISRRSGTRYVDTVAGSGRLMSFEFNTEQVYLLVVSENLIDVYRDDVKVASIVTPWNESQIRSLVWVQSADTLLVVHPDVPVLHTLTGVWGTGHFLINRMPPSTGSSNRCTNSLMRR